MNHELESFNSGGSTTNDEGFLPSAVFPSSLEEWYTLNGYGVSFFFDGNEL